MTEHPGTRHVEHQVTALAPADTGYELIADVTHWPRVFPPTVHIEHEQLSESEERIRLWATANGAVKTWTSRRRLGAGARRVEFRQEISQPPVAAMGGTWIAEPLAASECAVRLLHDYRAVEGTAENLAWIDRAVDRNSTAELGALKSTAELGSDRTDLMLTFEDTVQIASNAEDFERAFQVSSEFMCRQPGFLRHRLVRSTLSPGRYVNIAEWADAVSFRRATEHPDFESHVRELRKLASGEPHLCVPVLQRGALRGYSETG